MAACVSAAACAMGMTKESSPWKMVKNDNRKGKDRRCVKVACSSSVMDPYRTLRIKQGASESEVKKAFRRLALQYHQDVSREGSDNGVAFHMINEAYDVVMKQLRGDEEQQQQQEEEGGGGDEEDWEMWEEWMGWEGAGIRDYSSHINPNI